MAGYECKGDAAFAQENVGAVVSGAMHMRGVGVLALRRAMRGPVAAKHRIKRVDRFLGNGQVEVDAVGAALFHALRPASDPVIVLADWTDRHPFQQLVLSLPRSGRTLPFLSITVGKGDDSGDHQGLRIEAEAQTLETLGRFRDDTICPIVIADRGFGNARRLGDIQKRGWHFVQRLARNPFIDTDEYIGLLSELGIRRGRRPRSWGWGEMGDTAFGPLKLVTVFERDAKEAWCLVTNLPYHSSQGRVGDPPLRRFFIDLHHFNVL